MRRLVAMIAVAGLTSNAAGARTEGVEEGTPMLVTMTPITVPIIDADRLQGALQMTLVLNVGNADASAHATLEMPRLRAAAVAAALDFARLRASTLTAIDVGQLDIDLSKALKAVEPGLARVLIVDVSAMPV